MAKNTGKVREFCHSRKVGTMFPSFCHLQKISQSAKIFSPLRARLHQRCVNTAITLAILLSSKTMEPLQLGLQPIFE